MGLAELVPQFPLAVGRQSSEREAEDRIGFPVEQAERRLP